MSDSLQPHELQSARVICLLNSLGKKSEVGCHSLLQGIFLTQGSNPGLLNCRQILHLLIHMMLPPIICESAMQISCNHDCHWYVAIIIGTLTNLLV